MPEFSDRLSYLDKRYEHLRKNMQTLKRKINELEIVTSPPHVITTSEDVMQHDNDEENMKLINEIIEEIKIEKLKLKDEASIIRGELAQAMQKENLRKIHSGELRRAQREKDEYEERMQKLKELREQEEKEQLERAEVERQRREAKNRLLQGVLAAAQLQEDQLHSTPGCSNVTRGCDSGYGGYESEYDNEPSTIHKVDYSKMALPKKTDQNVQNGTRSGNDKVHPLNTGHLSGAHKTAIQVNGALKHVNLADSRSSQDSGIVRGHDTDEVLTEDESPRPSILCFGKWRGSKSNLVINKGVRETEL